MKTSDFYFDLPQELIAQDPLEDRSASRLLVLDKKTGEMEHRHFYDITDYLHNRATAWSSTTRRSFRRVFTEREEGTEALIEILLLKRKENDVWETLVKPGKKARSRVQRSFSVTGF